MTSYCINSPLKPDVSNSNSMRQALDILDAEHRSLRAVLQAMLDATHEARLHRLALDCTPIRLMLQYIRSFPDSLHHPKEDQYLFPRLKQRTARYDDILNKLTTQHQDGEKWLQKIEASLAHFEAGYPPAYLVFADMVQKYCEYQAAHLDLEERVVFPAAVEHFSEEDWEVSAAAFGANGPSRFAAQEKSHATLYSKISRLEPGEDKQVVPSAG